jgi:tetratricopeptide (TPR) repeat protein
MIMVRHLFLDNPSFRQVAKGLVELHGLIKKGKDDSPEAESVRDALDAPLAALSENERKQAQWLSEDLYAVSEPSEADVQKEMNAQAQQMLYEALEARHRGEWDQSLKLLRRWRDYISPTLLSFLRGSIWLEAGHPDIAVVFYRHASEREPANANYRSIYLHVLSLSDPDGAEELAGHVLADADNFAPVVVARAADISFNKTKKTSDVKAAKLYRQLIQILERNIKRIEEDETTTSRASAYVMTVALLGFCNEFLGDVGAAIGFYSRGLQADADNDGLLVARGMLQYGASIHAIDDLERAARLGSPMVWPYLFLAHHYLITSQFERCRAMCETGFTKQASNTAKSQLQEWRAIAQAELGFPVESVRTAFEAAIRADPNNEFARRNQIAFEASLIVPPIHVHHKWERKTETAIRQLGLAERRYSLAA